MCCLLPSEAVRICATTKEDHLTIDERIELWASACYLCGREPALGIDRIDSTAHYTMDNVAPCCSSCNYFKRDMSPIEIKTHIAYIYNYTAMWGLGEDKLISNCGKEKVPVAAYDANGTTKMVFPSVATAAARIGCNCEVIANSMGDDRFCYGSKWREISHATFFDSSFPKDAVKAFIQHARDHVKRRNSLVQE